VNPLHPTVAWLTWRQMFAHRRLWLATGVALLPALFAGLFLLMAGPETERTGFFVILQREIVIGTLLPITALVFGTAAFGSEVEDGTIVYLLVKPIARWRVVTTKYMTCATAAAAVMVPAVLIPWVLLRTDTLPAAVARGLISGTVAGAVVYTAFFVMLGLLTKRAFTIGLVYVIGFENVLARSGGVGVKWLSIREFSVSVAQSIEGAASTLGTATIPLATVRNVGATIIAVSLAVAIWRYRRYQLAERL
jgi:ABC-2 type transport system permease protein